MKVGTNILEEEPYCHVLLHKFTGSRCDRCFDVSDDLKKCTGCSSVYYCNKTCQKRDWVMHKKECKCLKAVLPKIPQDSVRLLLRLVISSQLQLPMNSPWSVTMDDLMSHAEELKGDMERSEDLAKMMYTLTKYAGNHVNLPSPPQILVLFGKMVINSMTVCDGELNDIGTAIYLSGSKLDHDCNPNAVATFHGTTLVVKATENMEDISPNKVCISYVEQMAPTAERQAALRKQYYFDCTCVRCTDDNLNAMMVSFTCPNQTCSGAIGLNDNHDFVGCTECGIKDFPKQLIQGALQVLEDCKSCLVKIGTNKGKTDSKAALDQCKAILKKCCGVLHANNVYRIRVLNYAMDTAIKLEEWELAEKYGCQTLQAYRKFYPEFSPNVGVQLFRVGKLQLYLQKLEAARKSLEQAEQILAITHGTNHSLYNQVVMFLSQCREEMRVNLDLC